MPLHSRSSFLTLGLAVLAWMAALPTHSLAEDGTGARKPLLPFAPGGTPTPRPWHKYGEFVVGAGLGASFYSGHVDANDDGSLSSVDDDGSSTVREFRAGFLGKFIGVEFGHLALGEVEFSAQSSGGPSWAAGDVSARVQADGWFYSAIGRYPVQDRWVLLARVGMLSWTTEESFTENGIDSEGSEDSGSDFMYGVGIEYDIYNRHYFWVRTEFAHGTVDDDELPVNLMTVSLDFRF